MRSVHSTTGFDARIVSTVRQLGNDLWNMRLFFHCLTTESALFHNTQLFFKTRPYAEMCHTVRCGVPIIAPTAVEISTTVAYASSCRVQ